MLIVKAIANWRERERRENLRLRSMSLRPTGAGITSAHMLIVGWEVLVVKSCALGTQARGQFFYYTNQPEARKLLIYLFLSLSLNLVL